MAFFNGNESYLKLRSAWRGKALHVPSTVAIDDALCSLPERCVIVQETSLRQVQSIVHYLYYNIVYSGNIHKTSGYQGGGNFFVISLLVTNDASFLVKKTKISYIKKSNE